MQRKTPSPNSASNTRPVSRWLLWLGNCYCKSNYANNRHAYGMTLNAPQIMQTTWICHWRGAYSHRFEASSRATFPHWGQPPRMHIYTRSSQAENAFTESGVEWPVCMCSWLVHTSGSTHAHSRIGIVVRGYVRMGRVAGFACVYFRAHSPEL